MDVEIRDGIEVSSIAGYSSYIMIAMPITYEYARSQHPSAPKFAPARTEWMMRMDDVRSWLKDNLNDDTDVVYMGAYQRRGQSGKEQTIIKVRVSFASDEDATLFFLHFK